MGFTCPECNEDKVVYVSVHSNLCTACGEKVPNSEFCIKPDPR